MHQIAQVSQSSKGRPELDGVTLRYAQDLLAWVEENQRRINESEWGSDLPTVESNLGSHRGLHQSVEDFRAKIERAKTDEVRTRVEDSLVLPHVMFFGGILEDFMGQFCNNLGNIFFRCYMIDNNIVEPYSKKLFLDCLLCYCPFAIFSVSLVKMYSL